jgi:GNAT superfamily N-acetyltransferase
MSEYTIRPYIPNDNAGLARMWNGSDDQWPGTFTQGVPFTEEFVQDWMDKEVCLMRLVIENGADNGIIGYGSLFELPGHEESCLVELLNIHPDHQKRSLARRILTRMLDWATDNGYRRVIIETWPGNLKSVPLYKKVGFFWTPDTDVYMENYIPAIRQSPFGRRFFARHDWYTTFRRELAQVEDDQRHPATGDMKVYVLRWEEGGEFLETVIDRQGQTLAGLETEHFAACIVVDESEPAQGIAYPVRWRVVNKRDEPVSVSVLADGETGVTLNHQASFTLAAGEERVVEAAFTCAVDAPRLDPGDETKPAPRIKTTVVIGGEAIELGAGLRYRPAVEISAEPEFPSLLPGRSKTIHLQLRNRAGRPLSGALQIAPQEGLTTNWSSHEFEADTNGYVGLPLTVTCGQAGATPLQVTATFVDDEKLVTTAPQRIPLLVTPVGGVSAGQGEDKLVIENDFFQLVCRTRGGDCLVRSKARQRRDASIKEEMGPPFEPWELREKHYDLALEHGQGWAKAILTVRPDRFFGSTLVREITVTGSPLVRVDYRVVNNGATSHKLQIRPRVWFADKDRSHVALPRKERLVIARAPVFPAANGDVPRKPELLAEQWMSLTRDGQVTAAIWNEDVVEHEFWWENLYLYFSERTVEPQSAVSVGPLYLHSGPGDWLDVRRAWQRTTGTTTEWSEESGQPQTFDLLPSPLVTLNDQVEARLRADNVRKRALQGHIVVEPPPDWKVDRAEFTVEGLLDEKPLEETVRLAATNGRVGAFSGQLRLEGDQFDEARPFTIIRLGDEHKPVYVGESPSEADDQPVWVIDNGRCSWAVAPDYHGGVVAWREMHNEVNHLMTAFPENGELSWLKPWFGGIWPIIMPVDTNKGWPGKLHEETFTAAPVEVADARGFSWRGIQVATSMKREGFEGLRAEIAYLTVGGSNVLKATYRLVNETSVYRRFDLGLLAFCEVDEDYEEAILHSDGFQHKRTPQSFWINAGSWGAAVNPTSGRALVHIGASSRRQIELADWGTAGGHLFAYNRAVLAPHASHELVSYLALVESLEEAERYSSLAHSI